ncbi:hypothetical protein PVAG01_01189 [Phlyctema vagabunda]|uniref:Uncharacterized protein n=1 Tax=Phlyctema vagabunda TaxID=108571 RepID=A0ABR4PWD4_9HELO
MARHDRSANPFTILVLEAGHVLDSSGMGTILCGVAAVLPTGTARQHQHTSMGVSMRCDYIAGQRCHRCTGSIGDRGEKQQGKEEQGTADEDGGEREGWQHPKSRREVKGVVDNLMTIPVVH